MVTECLLTRSMLIKMYLSLHDMYHFMVCACICTLYLQFNFMQLLTQSIKSNCMNRQEDHTDWEMAPPSYDLQSWGSLGLNGHLRILYPHEPL